jgi:hypothetical protein
MIRHCEREVGSVKQSQAFLESIAT